MSREEKGARSKAKLRGNQHEVRTEPRIVRSRYERKYKTYWRARCQGHPRNKPQKQGLRSTMNPYHKEQQSWGRKMGNNKDERGLTDLPPEIIYHIMCYMDLETLSNTSLMCKAMYNVSNDQRLWDKLTLRIPHDWESAEEILNHKKFKGIKKIHMPILNWDMKRILKRIQEMRDIEELIIGESHGEVVENIWNGKKYQIYRQPILHFSHLSGKLLKGLASIKKVTIPENEMLPSQEIILKELLDKQQDSHSITLVARIDTAITRINMGDTWAVETIENNDSLPDNDPRKISTYRITSTSPLEDRRITRRCVVSHNEEHIFTIEAEFDCEFPPIRLVQPTNQ